MSHSVRSVRTSLTASLALAVALLGCAPQALQQVARTPELPTAVVQASQAVLPAGSFSGVVAAFDGEAFKPVAGARIEVMGTQQVVTTDAEGQYRVTGLAAGTYTYVVTKAGFERGESQVVLSPVAGTPRANVALNPVRPYALQQAAGSVTLSGVVKDPRGAALGSVGTNKTIVRVAAAGVAAGSSSTTVEANAQGFYTTSLTLAGQTVSAASPGFVQVSATGTSPGGVALASTAAHSRTVTGATAVLDPRCDAYTAPGLFTFPSGTFVRLTDANPEAVVEVERASARADEFYIEVTDAAAGGATYAVLANSVTDVVGANPPRKTIRFRPPATISGNTFSCRYRPFGIGTVAFGSNYVARYTQDDFDNDVGYFNEELGDWSKSTAEQLEPGVFGLLARNVNEGLWVPGETARYTLELSNSNVDVSQDIRLRGTAPVGANGLGTRITRVLLTTRRAGAVVDDRRPLTVNTNYTINNATGEFEVQGFNIPSRVGGNDGRARSEVDFESPPNLPAAADFVLTNLTLAMRSANLTLTTLPGSVILGSQGFTDGSTRGNLVTAPGSLTITKAIANNGTGADGVAEVTLTITPGTSTALGAFRITDVTATSLNTAPAPATLQGTTTLAAAGTGVIQAGESLRLRVNGTLTQAIGLPGNDLETLCAFINFATNNAVTATRDANNRLRIVHNTIGSAATLAVADATTDSLSQRLGLQEEQQQSGADGLVADVVATGTGISTANTPVGAWTFTGLTGGHTAPGGVGRLTATFNVVPPAAALVAGDTHASPITVRYNIRRTNNIGGHTLGGGGVGFGATITAVNTLTPFTDAARDVAVTGITVGDALILNPVD